MFPPDLVDEVIESAWRTQVRHRALPARVIAVLMSQAGIYGLPGPARVKRLRGVVTADDLVNRKFARSRPNQLWVTDITEHPTPWIPAVVATVAL